MFRDVDRTDITIYVYNGKVYKKVILNNCIVSYGVQVEVKDKGVLPIDSIRIQIPLIDNDGYSSKWKLNVGIGYESDYVVIGNCKFNFNNELLGRDAQDEIRSFEKEVSYYRPMAVLERTKGSLRMRHIEVIC